jgi:hypothetical protein
MVHEYDQAVKLARMWGLSFVPIMHAFAKTCVSLVYNIPPASGDPADYVRHLDISGKSICTIPFKLRNAVEFINKFNSFFCRIAKLQRYCGRHCLPRSQGICPQVGETKRILYSQRSCSCPSQLPDQSSTLALGFLQSEALELLQLFAFCF